MHPLWLGGIFPERGLMRMTGVSSTTMLLHVTLRLRRCDARQQDPHFQAASRLSGMCSQLRRVDLSNASAGGTVQRARLSAPIADMTLSGAAW